MIHTTASNLRAIANSSGSEQQYRDHLRSEIAMFEAHLASNSVEPKFIEIDRIFTEISLRATKSLLQHRQTKA